MFGEVKVELRNKLCSSNCLKYVRQKSVHPIKNRLKEQEPVQEEVSITEALALARGLHMLNCEE